MTADNRQDLPLDAEKPRTRNSETLRISGDIPDPEAISRRLELAPAHSYRKGERRGGSSPEYPHDQWLYTAPIAGDRPLEEHLLALWNAIWNCGRIAYLVSLKRSLNIDVLCGYRNDGRSAGFRLGPECLQMFSKLGIPLGVSVTGTPEGSRDGESLDSVAGRAERERLGDGTTPERDALFRAVREQPRDDAIRLVFSDWLEENGQTERAEFIRFQIETEGQEWSRELLARAEVFRPLERIWEKEIAALPGVRWAGFERGFMDGVTFDSVKAFLRHAEAVFAASPVTSVDVKRITDRTVRDVLACPHLARLKRLDLLGRLTDVGVGRVASCSTLADLETLCIWGGGFGDAAAEALARSPHLKGLRCLSFSGERIGDNGALALADSPNLAGLTDLVMGTRELSRTVLRKLKKRFARLD